MLNSLLLFDQHDMSADTSLVTAGDGGITATSIPGKRYGLFERKDARVRTKRALPWVLEAP